jgi:hypothetical protein
MSLSNKLRKGEYVTGRSSSGATVQIEYDVEGQVLGRYDLEQMQH